MIFFGANKFVSDGFVCTCWNSCITEPHVSVWEQRMWLPRDLSPECRTGIYLQIQQCFTHPTVKRVPSCARCARVCVNKLQRNSDWRLVISLHGEQRDGLFLVKAGNNMRRVIYNVRNAFLDTTKGWTSLLHDHSPMRGWLPSVLESSQSRLVTWYAAITGFQLW